MEFQDEFKKFLLDNNLRQSYVARSLGVSPSLISQWLKGNYKGDVTTFEQKIKNYMKNFNKSSLNESEEIYETTDMRMVFFTFDEAIVAKKMCLVYGEAGSGKTEAVKAYVKTHPEAILIEVIPGMSNRELLRLICEKANVSGARTPSEMIQAISKEFERRETFLIIDEAENLTTKALESIRRIWDFSRSPVALVGTYNVIRNLKGRNGELRQLFRRIIGKWEMRGLTDEEWIHFFGDLADEIKRYTTKLSDSVAIYQVAKRLATLNEEEVNAGYINQASEMILLED